MRKENSTIRDFESRFPELKAQREIGEELETILANYPKPLPKLAQELSSLVGLNERSTYQYLLDLRRGHIHSNRECAIRRDLIRLAIVLQYIGTNEDAEIIVKLRRYSDSFTYPPTVSKLEPRKRRSEVIPKLEDMIGDLNVNEAEQVIDYIIKLKEKKK